MAGGHWNKRSSISARGELPYDLAALRKGLTGKNQAAIAAKMLTIIALVPDSGSIGRRYLTCTLWSFGSKIVIAAATAAVTATAR